MFNGNYVAYFDVVMTELWRETLGPYQEMVDAGTDMVVAEINVRFLAPARFDDEIEVDVRISRIGTSSVTYEFAAYLRGEVLAAKATQTVVLVDLVKHEPCRVPDSWREKIREIEGDDLEA